MCTRSLPPRAGASKLQPIIATIHERLKAAQVRLGGPCTHPLPASFPCTAVRLRMRPLQLLCAGFVVTVVGSRET